MSIIIPSTFAHHLTGELHGRTARPNSGSYVNRLPLPNKKAPDGCYCLYKGYEKDIFEVCHQDLNSNIKSIMKFLQKISSKQFHKNRTVGYPTI